MNWKILTVTGSTDFKEYSFSQRRNDAKQSFFVAPLRRCERSSAFNNTIKHT